MSHVFISYSRRDRDPVLKIKQALEEKGLDIWIDQDDIPKGEDWEQKIYRGVEEADAFLFMISPNSIVSPICIREMAHAVKNGKRILPIVVRDTESNSIPSELARLNWIYCRDSQDDFSEAVTSAETAIKTDYAWREFHTKLQVKALAWEERKDDSRLLRGGELKEIEKKMAESGAHKDLVPTELMHRYVAFSRRWSDRQRKTLIALSSLGVLTIGFLLSYRSVAAEFLRWRAYSSGRMVMIEQGRVRLGDDMLAKTGLALEEREYPLDGFEMEIYEVTNQRYSRCVSAGECTPPNGSFDEAQDAFKPVVQVTVKQAMTFCAWIDRRLPSEIEWERAARYTDFRSWPWGGDAPPSDDLHAILNYELLPNNFIFTRDVGITLEGASEEGVFDLIGNVWEWTCTPTDASPEDCWNGQADEPLPASFVIRGGGANIPPNPSLVSAYRQPADWDFNQNRFLGFRCVDVP